MLRRHLIFAVLCIAFTALAVALSRSPLLHPMPSSGGNTLATVFVGHHDGTLEVVYPGRDLGAAHERGVLVAYISLQASKVFENAPRPFHRVPVRMASSFSLRVVLVERAYIAEMFGTNPVTEEEAVELWSDNVPSDFVTMVQRNLWGAKPISVELPDTLGRTQGPWHWYWPGIRFMAMQVLSLLATILAIVSGLMLVHGIIKSVVRYRRSMIHCCLECGHDLPAAGIELCSNCGWKASFNYCPDCRYDLTGLSGSYCPECGWRRRERNTAAEEAVSP